MAGAVWNVKNNLDSGWMGKLRAAYTEHCREADIARVAIDRFGQIMVLMVETSEMREYKEMWE
jgi:hypothetical protein